MVMASPAIKSRAAERAKCSTSKRHESKNASGEEMSSRPIFDLDDPEIGIAFDLTGDVGFGGLLIDGRGPGSAQPTELALEAAGLSEHDETVLKLIELDQDGTGIGIAAARHDHRNRLLRR